MSNNWIDVLAVIMAISLLKGAITGAFYSSGRGGNRALIGTVKSAPIRLAIAMLAVGLLVWSIHDWLHRI